MSLITQFACYARSRFVWTDADRKWFRAAVDAYFDQLPAVPTGRGPQRVRRRSAEVVELAACTVYRVGFVFADSPEADVPGVTNLFVATIDSRFGVQAAIADFERAAAELHDDWDREREAAKDGPSGAELAAWAAAVNLFRLKDADGKARLYRSLVVFGWWKVLADPAAKTALGKFVDEVAAGLVPAKVMGCYREFAKYAQTRLMLVRLNSGKVKLNSEVARAAKVQREPMPV